MGKKGDLLRAAKAARVTRTFTEEQLREHDHQVREEFKKSFEKHLKKTWNEYDQRQRKEFDEHINKVWRERAAEFNAGTPAENMDVMLSYLLSVSARVLIEQFGWTPVEGRRFSRRNKIVRFCDAVINEIEGITKDTTKGIQEYAAETYKKYGVRFQMQEE